MPIKIKRLHPDAVLPDYSHPGDAGLNLYAVEDGAIAPGGMARFNNGFALEMPFGYVAIVKDRSSMAKNGLHCLGGVFDAGYRGEYNVQLINLGAEPYEVKKGNKIAQLVILPVAETVLTEVAELSESSRGMGAFGSTGK